MRKTLSLFLHTLFTSLAPLFVYALISLFEHLLSSSSLFNLDFQKNLENLSFREDRNGFQAETLLFSSLLKVKSILLDSYRSFFNFLLLMAIVNITYMIGCWIISKKSKMEELSNSMYTFPSQDITEKRAISQGTMKRIFHFLVFYGVIYYWYQLAANELPLVNNTSQESIIIHDDLVHRPTRLLETIHDSSQSEYHDADIRSLLVHRVLSSLDIDLNYIVLSKDSKLAFIVTREYGELIVVDISDREYPMRIGSLNLRASRISEYKSLKLSADEKVLFASNVQYLEVIDVSKPQKPVKISEISDPTFDKYVIKTHIIPRYYVPTLALSPDEKTFFVAGLGLQIFNITNLPNPQILFSIASPRSGPKISDDPISTSLALLPDGKTLAYANSTLDFYDVSNPATPQLVNSYSDKEISISSLLLSRDSRTIYAAGFGAKSSDETSEFAGSQLVLKKIDIFDPLSPQTLDFYDLGNVSRYLPCILGISQTETNIFIMQGMPEISGYVQTIAYDLIKKKVMVQPNEMFKNTVALAMIPNTDILIAGSHRQFQIIQLYRDFPNRKTLCLFHNTSYQLPVLHTDILELVKQSADPNVFFSVTFTLGNWQMEKFEAYNMTNKTSPQRLGSYQFEPKIRSLELRFFHMSPSKDKVFLGLINNVLILNVSDPTNISSLGVISRSQYDTLSIVVSPLQEGIAFFLENPIHTTILELSVINYSNISSITKTLYARDVKGATNPSHLLLSKDGHILFSQLDNLTVYNVSDPFNPIEISVHQLLPHESSPKVYSLVLSDDEKTLFTVLEDDADLYTFRIFDISDLTNFKLLQAVALPRPLFDHFPQDLIISNVNKKALLIIDQGILVIDLRNLTSPFILGIIPLERGDILRSKSFSLSPDEKTAYVQISQHMVQIKLENSFTLYLPQEDFLLGQKYTDSPMFLQLNETSDFLLTSSADYKIVKLALYDFKIISSRVHPAISYTPLPSWITFDSENQILSVESKKQRDLGSYTLHALASKKIPFEAFNSISSNQDLLTLLVTLGYIDNQRFLTSTFGSFNDFLLPSKETEFKGEIYRILESYRIQTFTGFRILPSLKLSTIALDKKLSMHLATPSNTSVKIDIKLTDSTKAQFLQKTYGTLQPTITERKSRLTMEGPLDSLNKALQDLVINLDASCGGEITISDNLNRPVTEFIENISDYFWHNDVPKIHTFYKLSVQQQIDLTPLYTGQHFSINLNPSSFSDKFADSLSYELIQREDGQDKSPPDWLTFHNLKIQGTPPEELLHRKINLTLIIKNEFKQIETHIVLNIKISWTFAGKTLLRYSPYILTTIGLLVFANKIRNVLAKKRYRHPKDFYVRVGDEITPSVIFPIRFIAEEKAEGDLILKYLERKMGSRSQAVESLLSYSELDGVKIKASMKEIVSEIPTQDKKKLGLYLQGLHPGEERVYKYIMNELTMWQLNLSSQETKDLFDSLKEKWTEFIEYDNHSDCFRLTENILHPMIPRETSKAKESFSDTENESLLSESSPEVDLILLKKALIVYVNKIHELNCFDFQIDVQVKLQVPKNNLLKFLKMDLQKINYVDKSRFMYGLSYRIQKNALHILGTPDESFTRKVLVLQITNNRQRILKELWILETSHSGLSLNKSSIISESQAKGKEYEIF